MIYKLLGILVQILNILKKKMFTVQQMNAKSTYIMKFDSEEHLNLMRKISKNPKLSQRDLAGELDMSLGKVNYCLLALKKKGLVKIKNFQKSKNKLKYFYVLTPRGITEKTRITLRFMKQKIKEYDELKKELKNKK